MSIMPKINEERTGFQKFAAHGERVFSESEVVDAFNKAMDESDSQEDIKEIFCREIGIDEKLISDVPYFSREHDSEN